MSAKKDAPKKSLTVRDMPLADRPRERLQRCGAKNISALELLAVILGRGIAGESVMVTAQRLLSEFSDLRGLADADFEQLMKVKGIGPAKACQIKAALELAERLNGHKDTGSHPYIKNPEDVASVVCEMLREKMVEHFWVIMLDSRGRMIRCSEISKGSLDCSIVHPREVFKEAIAASAASVIFVHNHPSGNSDASEDDIKLTKRLAEAGEIMGIDVLDHIIIGSEKPFSLKRNGLF